MDHRTWTSLFQGVSRLDHKAAYKCNKVVMDQRNRPHCAELKESLYIYAQSSRYISSSHSPPYMQIRYNIPTYLSECILKLGDSGLSKKAFSTELISRFYIALIQAREKRLFYPTFGDPSAFFSTAPLWSPINVFKYARAPLWYLSSTVWSTTCSKFLSCLSSSDWSCYIFMLRIEHRKLLT